MPHSNDASPNSGPLGNRTARLPLVTFYNEVWWLIKRSNNFN